MINFGNLSLTLAFGITVYSLFAMLAGVRTHNRSLVKSGETAILASLWFVSCAIAALVVQLVRSDFSIEYVASYTNRALPLLYKLAALWGGQKGSLLLWTWLLTIFSSILVVKHRRRQDDLLPYALVIMALTTTFFLLLNKFVANPFDVLTVQSQAGAPLMPFSPEDGRGLNPLLQHPEMIIHPPVLYIGFVGVTVPFAFAIAALITRAPSSDWLKLTRRWSLASWFFLGAGIMLGANWAYVELGWGGYWAWDPVENASLMPWLTGTAFLHSVIVQERRGMLKVWNVSLVVATFLLCILGTFITRSGIVSSVHAFAKSSIGYYFLAFMALTAIIAMYFIFTRLKYLKSEHELDSLVSRESSFMFNNLILLVACFAVLFGTLFPAFAEYFKLEKLSIGPAYFNRINVPVGLFLLLLTGVAPLLTWRKTSGRIFLRSFILPGVAALVTAALVFGLAGVRSAYPLIAFSLAGFVVMTIIEEFYRGVSARIRMTGEPPPAALWSLILKSKRRYGGYIVHLGIVMMFVGFAGGAFNTELYTELEEGGQIQIKDYTLVCKEIEDGENANFAYLTATFDVLKNGRRLYTLYPQKRFYLASEQSTSEVAIKSNLKDDVYVVFAGINDKNSKAVIQAFVNPLVIWVWIGSFVLGLGTLLTVLPDRRQRRLNKQLRQLDKILEMRESA